MTGARPVVSRDRVVDVDRWTDGEQPMLVWPAVAVIGFVLLMAFVIDMGTLSVERYERERRAQTRSALRTGRSIGVAGTS
jgi:hypothetical protein